MRRPPFPLRPSRLLALVAVLALVLAGCSSDDSSDDSSSDDATAASTTSTTAEASPPSTLNVTSTDYAYALDTEEVATGLVTVNQDNQGAENHQVTLVRLEDGQTAADVAAGLEAEGDGFVAATNYAGGPNNTIAGETGSATVSLTEGSYALVCFIPNQDGESHFALGMLGEVDVVASPGGEEAPAAPPTPDASVSLVDFAFDYPDDLPAAGTIEVTNDGTQAHEWTVGNLDNTAGTGLAAIAPGAVAYVPIDLAAGDYSFNCFVADPETRTPHVALAMTAQVTLPGGGSGTTATSTG